MATAKAVVATGSKYAAKVRNQFFSPAPLDNVWMSRLIPILYTIAVPFAFYFKPLCVLAALGWLLFRAYDVLGKPLDELSYLLGFDIPSTPAIDLADIKADGAIIHWTLPEKPKHKSQLKYEVYLNGTVIDHVSLNESAVTITGLQPNSFYIVRIGLVHNEISSKSSAIRFRTKLAESGDFYNVGIDGHETDTDAIHSSIPRVRPYRALKDFTPATPTSASMTREPSSGLSAGKTNSRRPSPAALGIDPDAESPFAKTEAAEPSATIHELTARLDSIRRETEDLERQAKLDEEEDLKQKEELTKERDALKLQVSEKEKASKSLRKDIGALERQNTIAQNERQKHERLLQQKIQERKKLKDDAARWEEEAEKMNADTERIKKEHAAHLEAQEQEKKDLQSKLEEEVSAVQTLEEQVKAKTAEIKTLERTMKEANSPSADRTEAGAGEPTILQQQQSDAEEDRKWQVKRASLQQLYQMAYNKLDNAKRFHAEQIRYLESLRAERRRQDESTVQQYVASPTMLDRVPRRGDSRRSRASVSDSPRLGAFQVANSQATPFPNGMNAGAGGFNRFINYQNGMTLNNGPPGPTGPTMADEVTMSDEERQLLTGGAAMSPSAGADLIPADLFSGDGDTRPEHVPILPGLGSLPNLPGLGGVPGGLPHTTQHAQQQEHPGASNGPASPAASSSHSASVFASPQASQPNLILGSPDNGIDPDRRSIRSTRSTRAPSGGNTGTGSRFSGMFGIKQRNKTVSEDSGGAGGPPLSKASSMPRQDQGIPGIDSNSRKRNSSISGTAWEGGLDGTTETSSSAAPPGRRAFGLFSKDKGGGWPSTFTAFGRRPVSPRPGSTHSNELPRPSLEGGVGSSGRWGGDAWSSTDAAAGARGSPLAFGDGWNAPQPQQSRLFGSGHPSRRPSVQYGASRPPDDILEGDDDDYDPDALDPNSAPHLAPIGTKPAAGSKKPEPKLNPNAKDFKSFFKFGAKSKEVASSSAENDGSGLPASSSTASNLVAPVTDNEDSPPHSRKSRDTRDTRSMTTAETSSLSESAGGRNSPDLVRTPSYSNSDVAAPSPSLQAKEKESLMQKISRKSSSSKFSLPTYLKREKSSRLDPALASNSSNTSNPTPSAERDEEDAGLMEESVGSLRDITSTPTKDAAGSGVPLAKTASRSWSSAFKLGKKKGVETASGAEDGDEEEEA